VNAIITLLYTCHRPFATFTSNHCGSTLAFPCPCYATFCYPIISSNTVSSVFRHSPPHSSLHCPPAICMLDLVDIPSVIMARVNATDSLTERLPVIPHKGRFYPYKRSAVCLSRSIDTTPGAFKNLMVLPFPKLLGTTVTATS